MRTRTVGLRLASASIWRNSRLSIRLAAESFCRSESAIRSSQVAEKVEGLDEGKIPRCHPSRRIPYRCRPLGHHPRHQGLDTLQGRFCPAAPINDELSYDMADSHTTHFGFREVPTGEKAKLVRSVFDSVAGKYDLMNDLMSLGIHRIWKRIALQLSHVRYGEKVLDLAGGTGDMTLLFRQRVGDRGAVVLSDINAEMLNRGRDRLIDAGVVTGVHYAQIDAEQLPFPDNHFDCVCIAFGLRNVTHKEKALESMRRVLKPGGRAIILEFSEVHSSLLKKVYDVYSFKALPLIGKLVANDAESYRYLAESIRMHPNQEKLKEMLVAAGFVKVDYYNLSHGIVAIHRGYKA